MKAGIITFHCADNYGAMLQAYGLKRYLCDYGIEADIVRYEPPFMTGRHWWFPYIPIGGTKESFKREVDRWKAHRRMKMDFFRLRANMRAFRRRYLVRWGQRKILFASQMKMLRYRCYIVGSDQIWNPDITCGLRKVYFGAFDNTRKEKVVAYAASLGGAVLADKYDEEFSRLLEHVDVVSLRESAAIPYLERFNRRNITAVLDPVFLLEKKEWEKIEKIPEKQGYILVYTTEYDKGLIDYVQELSRNKGLSVIQLKTNTDGIATDFLIDYTAGPSEFLGYIHKADYIVTNSFHMVAFSIIYQKKFLAFLHSSYGTRISNILQIYGLENRLCNAVNVSEIDDFVDWRKAMHGAEEHIKKSKEFLMEHICV